MSMYNLDADELLGVLGLEKADFGRFRNAYLVDGYIVVHTRCGGGNREYYEDVFDEMSAHPLYSHDEDCEGDDTYADIYFKVSEAAGEK